MEKKDDLLNYTIPQMLQRRARLSPNKVALREKDHGYWNRYTWSEYYGMVRKTALGLKKIGLREGDKLALIGDNIPEMFFLAIGTQSLGAISAGIYQTTLPDEIAQLLDYMDIKIVFCDDQEQVDKILEVRDRIPMVEKVIYEDPKGMRDYRADEWFLHVDDLYKQGEKEHEKQPALFETMIKERKPDEVCHLCLTSGTSGIPKATMMTHRNYINMGMQITREDPLKETDEYLSFLPFAWIGEQMNSFGVAMATGICINFPESVETSMEDLKEIGPHFMFGAPRIYETIRSQIWLKIDDSYRLNKLLYKYFIKIGERAAIFRMSGMKLPVLLRIRAWLANILIFKPLINQTGMLRLRRAYTGGAALGPELFTFYHAIGVNLKQIYGQTEITGIAYMHRDGDIRPDTVGKPLPETECRISDKGEILSRSPSVCSGYYKLPDETEKLLEGGWLHSGDAGYLDKDGHLVVIDRISDVMHASSGEMFSPMFLENRLKFSPYIKEAIIFGDKRDFIASLINIDPIVVGKWAEDRGISFTTYMDLSAKPEVADLIMKELISINRDAEKKHFKIHRFAILYKLLDMDDGELTKTGKIRREFVTGKYKELYDALFDADITEKDVETVYQYRDGQTTTVNTKMSFYTI
ncbi:MAG: AMP-binding protein [Deltaproteobacteria bacterium]|nr:AMP-binding protein [Deltaproteobacteria bacterium]